MGNFILNIVNRCRYIHRSASVLKKIMASALLCGSCMNVQALVITAENGTVCPNEGVILNSSLATSSSVTWQKLVNGAWVNASEEGSQLKVGVPFIYEMDDLFIKLLKENINMTPELKNKLRRLGFDTITINSLEALPSLITEFQTVGENDNRSREVNKLIRERYSLSQELQISRERDIKPEQFEEFNNYVEECIRKVNGNLE